MLVCGGGSGHEPAHAGFVCDQMLQAAVCGRVFASPSMQQVRNTLEYIIQDKKEREILVIIKNYTGDLLNFKAAVESIKAQYGQSHGVKIRTLDVGDDIALLGQQDSKMKPRGVAGTSLLYKILGAARLQEGSSLEYLHNLGSEVL